MFSLKKLKIHRRVKHIGKSVSRITFIKRKAIGEYLLYKDI